MIPRDEHPRWGVVKRALADRVRLVRLQMYGEDGVSRLAASLGVPERTWWNYESGVTIPAEVILRFVALTMAEPRWLLDGQGPIFRELARSPQFDGLTTSVAPVS